MSAAASPPRSEPGSAATIFPRRFRGSSRSSVRPSMRTLSIIIPVYNEAASIRQVLHAVGSADTGPFAKEIIIVDDGSTDGTRDVLKSLEEDSRYRIAYHDSNRGKGAALKTGFALAMGAYVLIQDADLEYEPSDYTALLEPVLTGRVDIVFEVSVLD